MKFRVDGAWRDTGKLISQTYSARSEQAAADAANADGILVTRVQPYKEYVRAVVEAGKAQAGQVEAGRESRRDTSRRHLVATGKHVQWVRLTGSSEFSLVVVIALGVFLGLLGFSCCGGGLMLSGLAGAFGQGMAP
jgi:hypothetical protein